jgi:hypothetical protein
MSATAYIQKMGQNVGTLVRDMFHPMQSIDAPFIKNHLATTQHPPAVGLDTTIVNNGNIVAVILLDGVPISISAGSTFEVTNTPHFEVRLVQGNNVDIYVQGIYVRTLEALRGRLEEEVIRTWL